MTYRDLLWDVACDQYGFVTTHDADTLGVPAVELAKLKHRGKLERRGYGIYRFPTFPTHPLDTYMLATLWADGRGALSHETVLELHELCDVNPPKIHITVPRGYTPRRKDGQAYVVHHANLRPDELGWIKGIRAVRPATALLQAVETIPGHLVEAAVNAARARGMITPEEEDHIANALASHLAGAR